MLLLLCCSCSLDAGSQLIMRRQAAAGMIKDFIVLDFGLIAKVCESNGYELAVVCAYKDGGMDMRMCEYVYGWLNNRSGRGVRCGESSTVPR